jgi:hypothetical protein
MHKKQNVFLLFTTNKFVTNYLFLTDHADKMKLFGTVSFLTKILVPYAIKKIRFVLDSTVTFSVKL